MSYSIPLRLAFFSSTKPSLHFIDITSGGRKPTPFIKFYTYLTEIRISDGGTPSRGDVYDVDRQELKGQGQQSKCERNLRNISALEFVGRGDVRKDKLMEYLQLPEANSVRIGIEH